jgi:tetratricopeptide (TPR) repeat protein
MALLVVATMGLAAQEASIQRLFESGNYDQVLDRGAGSAEDRYITALAALKADRRDAAADAFGRLRTDGDESWKQIGASGAALIDGNADEAINAARRAVDASGDNPFAHYQLGLGEAARSNWSGAAEAFRRAAELRPDFAYAHYNAGLAFQKNRNLGRAADHLGYFVKLAPQAPERGAVMGILQTLRK